MFEPKPRVPRELLGEDGGEGVVRGEENGEREGAERGQNDAGPYEAWKPKTSIKY